MTESHLITDLLRASSNGDAEAKERLVKLAYDELHRMAQGYMRRERPGHTLQPTALVHEAYVHLGISETSWDNRVHFFAAAAKAMRRILVDHARTRLAQKRGGDVRALSLEDVLSIADDSDARSIAQELALLELAKLDQQQASIVELRCYGGLTRDEIAVALGISPRTVDRDWRVAKAWLRRELSVNV